MFIDSRAGAVDLDHSDVKQSATPIGEVLRIDQFRELIPCRRVAEQTADKSLFLEWWRCVDHAHSDTPLSEPKRYFTRARLARTTRCQLLVGLRAFQKQTKTQTGETKN